MYWTALDVLGVYLIKWSLAVNCPWVWLYLFYLLWLHSQTQVHNSGHLHLIALPIIKETEESKVPLNTLCAHHWHEPRLFWHAARCSHAVPTQRTNPWGLYRLFPKLILQRWMITSTTVHLIPSEKRLLWALSTVISLKNICSAPNLTPGNSFWDLIITSPFVGPKWGQILLTLFFS